MIDDIQIESKSEKGFMSVPQVGVYACLTKKKKEKKERK